MKKKMLFKSVAMVLTFAFVASFGVNVFAANETKSFKIDDVTESLGEMLNYGVFAKEYSAQCHTEATIAVKAATQLGEYGFSGNNFNLINNKLTVNYDCLDKNLELVLLRNGEVYDRKSVSGKGTLKYEKMPGGTYEAKLSENGEYIFVDGNNSVTTSENYGNVSYIGKLQGTTSIGMPVGPGIIYLNDRQDYEKNKNYNARQGVVVKYTDNAIDFDGNLANASALVTALASAKTGGDFKVYNFKPSQLNSNDIVNNGFKSEGYEYILINLDVSGLNDVTIQGNYKRDNRSMSANFSNDWRNEAKIIYNVYTKSSGEIVPYNGTLREQNPLTGILLAPEATVYGAGNHGGIIIASKYVHHKGEVHQMNPVAEAFDETLDVTVGKEEVSEEPKVEEPEAPKSEEPKVEEPEIVPEPKEEPQVDTSISLVGAHYAYIFGYEPEFYNVIGENGENEMKVRVRMAMDDPATVEQVSSMLMRMLDQKGNTTDVKYPITPAVKPHEGTWYERGLAYLCSVGGFDENEVIETKPITRGQVAKLVACALKLNLTGDVPFEDVKGHEYEEYIKKVYKYDYMHGHSDKLFDPNAIMTRAEFCNLFNNIIDRNTMGLTAKDENGNEFTISHEDYYFVDMNPSHWAYEVCLKATSAYDEDGYIDVVTRTANIRNVLDHHEAQKLH